MTRRAWVGVAAVGLAFGLAGAAWPRAHAAEPSIPTAVSPSIRVAVVQRQPQADLAINGRFNLVGLNTAASLKQGSKLSKVEVRATAEGILVGDELLPLHGVRVEPVRDATIHVNGQRLRGAIEIRRQQGDTLLIVNHISLEDYLRGVLSKEAPHYWPPEALRSIAIAARTYALFQRITKASVDFDVSGDVLSQVYGGRDAENAPTSRAVRDTEGMILTYQGRVFPTFYHSTCGGRTEHGSQMGPFDIEPLRGNIQCSFCAASPFYRWQRRLSFADVSWALKQSGRGSFWPVTELAVAKSTMTGRVAKVRVRSTVRGLTLSGHDFRQLFGFDSLRSTAFIIRPVGDGVLLDGQGWGHGVGLCQWGTAELARRGLAAGEILAYYYPGAKLANVRDVDIEPIATEGGR